MLGGENGRSPDIDFLDAERHPCVRRLTQASSLLRRGSRFDSPIAARGERRERALRPATEPMRSSKGSIQVDESSRRERLKRMRTANMLGISERQAARRTTPADIRCHESAQRAGTLNGAYILTVYVCHAFCSKVQATSTDLFCGAGGAPQGGSDMIECLPGAHWPGSAWGCSVLELPASKSTTYFSSYRGHFSASPATKERSLKLASTATDS